jgi:hypothetical protein
LRAAIRNRQLDARQAIGALKKLRRDGHHAWTVGALV